MRRIAIIAVLLGLTLAPSAGAQQPGVFVDPDSPAGKEYAIPLEQARREAAGGASGGEGGGDAGGSGAQPLFGVGIERSTRAAGGEDAGAATSGGGGDGSTRGANRQGGGSAPGAGDITPNTGSSAAIGAAASDGSDALLTAGIVAAVFGVGLLAGFGLRRLLRDSHG